MTPRFKYTRASQGDIQQLGSILEQCFVMSSGDSKIYAKGIGLENFRVIYREDIVAGGLAILPMGQWWGGQRVPMAGIAAVGIAPEYRGDGAAIALIQHTLQDISEQEIPISVLYPATQRLYRKAGYEQAGTSCVWEISAESIQIRQQPLPVEPIIPKNQTFFRELYQQQAQLTHGYLDRHPAIWQGLMRTSDSETLYSYLIGDKDQPQGYIIFTQERTKDDTILRIRDWVMLSNAAVQSFWSFIANHRSQIDKVLWKSSVVDALTLLLPEHSATIKNQDRWMLRIVDVCKALEARGYPSGVDAELHLEVQDDLLTANNGKFILSVANCKGKVTQGGKGELQLDIRGLAPLYTGLFTPRQLQLTGKLNATETALLTATQIFASESPWMVDFF
ncbi:GNAT family N-acetyltransferase [Anabaena subtropica]|uniref:GNAT family N-acetyltransferase n=1 Tax=Anabaena subtropica FACHB-260 TaxID=2692884 RepID=A0ABR8CNS4_9NOST|nr:enhanced intracellular survival protein Eis [Anabaena subtropica]MBD2344120.1 GNAT family N-acetyltransferase [Anabaena subtropica FACHB-260]